MKNFPEIEEPRNESEIYLGVNRARLSDENHSLRPASTSTAVGVSGVVARPAEERDCAPLFYEWRFIAPPKPMPVVGLFRVPSARSFASVTKSFNCVKLPSTPVLSIPPSRRLARMIKSLVYISLCKRDRICYHQRLDLSSAYFRDLFVDPSLSCHFIPGFSFLLPLSPLLYID